MKQNKTIYLWPTLYAIITTVAGHIIRHVYHVKYAEPAYIEKLLPVLIAIVVVASIVFYYRRQTLTLPWEEKGHIGLYLLYTIPLIGIVAYFWSIQEQLSLAFFIPFIATFFVGIGEELVSRRVLFIGLLKERGFRQALLISSAVFGMLHGLNVFSGMPIKQALMQVGITFVAGIFLALMYDYTKNFYLIALQHWLWDYILLSGAPKENHIISLSVVGMMIIQIGLTVVLLIRKRRKRV